MTVLFDVHEPTWLVMVAVVMEWHRRVGKHAPRVQRESVCQGQIIDRDALKDVGSIDFGRCYNEHDK